MGKKEASKGREWEKGRRDVLNQAFCDLYKALPGYVEGRTISKKTILIQALASICQLKEEKGVKDVQGTERLESTAVQKWIHHILSKFSQLVLFLRVSNVEVPPDYVTLEAPPVCVRPDIAQLVSEIGTHRSSIIQKQKVRVKLKNDGSDSISLSNNSNGCTSPKKVLPTTGVKAIHCSNLKSDFNLDANPPMIQSNPVVVQPSPLQTQLLFTSGSPSAPLTSPLPLLVSVTGVKTVNPFILVQSNVMAPSPLSTQKVVCSANNARPIQPGPPNKALRKVKKVPIPLLKPKCVLRNISSQVTSRKFLKRDSGKIVPKSSGGANKEKSIKSTKGIKLSKATGVKPSNATVENKFSSPMALTKLGDTTSEKQPGTQVGEENQEIILEIDKENVAGNSNGCKLIGNDDKLDGLTSSASEEMCGTAEPSSIKGSSKEAIVEISSANTTVEQQLQIEENTTKTFKVPGNITTGKKRLCEVDINIENVKQPKCDPKACDTHCEKPDETSSNMNTTDEVSSPSKTSKSNYTISALCARQQLLQNPESTTEGSNSPQVMSHERVSDLLSSKPPSMRLTGDVSEGIVSDKSSDNFYHIGKSKGTISTEMYSEWSDKSKFKSDRACSSYNLFSSVPLHTNKNTFIPITDIENFKTVPESFDSTDSSFGLPLHSSDISNDIFASLQVPTGGHHSESISPTAAFLLAFPLVSTSKASELLSDEAVCENNDSQPGMKTILQIGNLDCDTPVTKCVSVFSSIDSSSIVDSASNVFSQDTLSSALLKNKSLDSSVDVGSFMQKHRVENNAQKCSNGDHLIPPKESSSFLQKNLQTSVSQKDSTSFSSKVIYQNPCSNNNKLTCQSRNESTSVPSVGSSGMEPGSELGGTTQIKTSLKLNASQQSTSFLTCEKQTDWLEMPHTSQGTFPDFSNSASRSDCAVNYVLPPTLMSSSTNGEELHSSTRHHSSSILSWSTMAPTENIQLSKSTSKLSHDQEAYSSTKVLGKPVEMQQLIPNHSVATSTSNHSQLIPGTGLAMSNKLTANAASYNQSQNIVTSSDQGLLLSSKQNVSSSNFISSGSNSVVKKTFSSKQVVCSSAEAIKVSSNSSGGVLFTHQQVDLRQGTEASSSSIAYPSSEVKQSRVNNPYYDNRAPSQSMKSGLNSSTNNQNSKQPVSVPNYNHSTNNPELKQTSAVASYSHVSSLNGKESIGNDHLMMNSYHHQSDNSSKQHGTSNSQFPVVVPDDSVSKKNIPHFNQHSEAPADHSKQNASGLNFNLENSSNMMQFGNSSVSSSSNHQEHFNDKSNSHEGHQVKPQSSQQRQHCGRSNNKEPVPNLHRPPVNWMTAPDIRSHQHHTGPSFGNNSNMNSTQGLFYLSEHTKDSENAASVFDQSTNFHCLDIPHSSQSLYKGNEIHLFGNETLENFHDNSAWSPNKNGGSSMLGNMMIPSTLPTLVGDLALGDNNISRPFLPPYNSDPQSCPKKSVKKTLNTIRRAADKAAEESNSVSGQTQECVATFLSVSQLVDTGSAGKNRANSSTKESNTSYTSFSEHESTVCHSSKQNLFKSVSSNYSTEALLSSTNTQQMSHFNHNRKRRSHGCPHYTNNYVATGMAYQNSSTGTLQAQGPQTQFLPDLPRANDYSGTFLHSDTVSSFMLGNPPRSHRNNSYPLQNISDRSSADENSNTPKVHHPASVPESPSGRHRSGNNNSIGSSSSSTQVASSSNIVDFGYMNMPSTMLQDDINFTNHPPPPPHHTFLSHHSYPMPSTQDTIYSTPRLTMHPPQNNNIQSPSATTLTNFHLSTIFPEINEKVIC